MDIVGKETLESMLKDYKGTLIFVSHDRYFVKKVATQLLVFEDGTTNLYQFGYEQYQEKLDREAEESKNVYRGNAIFGGAISQNGSSQTGSDANRSTSQNAAAGNVGESTNANSAAQAGGMAVSSTGKAYYNPGKERSKIQKKVKKAEEDLETVAADICRVLDQALAAYNDMRAVEGCRLAEDIAGRLVTIETAVGRVERQSPQTVSAYRERLEKKMREVLASTTMDEGRILTEAAIFADKVAVDEETVRLRSHVAQLRTMLQAQRPTGKDMDFLMQEFNRECNTIGSKCNDLAVTQDVVAMKAEVEKIREQVQNIE